MRKLAILAIFLLLTVQSATAVWDATGEIQEVKEGDFIPLSNNVAVRILEVGDVEEVVFLQVERKGVVIGSGAARKNKPFTIDNVVYVDMKGLTNYQVGGSVARVQFFQWVDGQFVGLHFPEKLNLKSLYDVFAIVANTGTKTGTFTVELTQAGEYIRRADRYEDEYGNLLPRLIDVQKPIRETHLLPGEAKRVEYDYIAPVRRQPSGNNELNRKGDMLFNLYYKGQLLDQLLLKDIELTTLQSGYIQDLRMPTTFRRDNPEEIELDILNAGPAYGGIERSKFNVRLETDNFYFMPSNQRFKTSEIQVSPEIVRGDLPAYLTKTWKVRLGTLAPPGDYNLKFILEHDKEIMDTFMLPITVSSGANTRITAIRVPEQVDMGEEFTVEVDVHNVGLGRDVVLTLEGDMIEETPRKHITLGNNEKATYVFKVYALGMGIERLDAKVLLEHLQDKVKNFDPYTNNDYEVHSKATNLFVYAPGVEVTSPTPVVEGVEVVEPVAPAAPVIPAVPYTPPTQPAVVDMPEWNIGEGMPILVVALIILAILIVVKVLFYYAE